MSSYSLRDISREAAARAVFISINLLDQFVFRFAVGGKRGGARLFSVRDLVTLVVARRLAGQMTLAEALALCGPLLADEPPPDAVLVHTAERTWIQPDGHDWPDCDCTMIYVGQEAQHIQKRLESPRVAIHKT